MSIFLPHALECSLPTSRAVMAELLLPLAGPDAFAETPEEQRAEAAIARIRSLRESLHAKAGLPRTLAETGKVERGRLPEIAKLAIDDGTLVTNARRVTYADALAVLERAYAKS